METIKKAGLFILIIAFVAGCKKEQLPPNSVIGQPVFSFNGTIGGSNVSFQAGLNNYYMYSSFAQNSAGTDSVIYSFIGNLQNTTSTKNSIQVMINDSKVSFRNASVTNHIDSSLSVAATYFYDKPGGSIDTVGYSVKFTPVIYSGAAISYTYSFGDGSSDVITASGAPVTHKYPTAGTYTTSLTVQFSGCGTITVSNPITIGRVHPQLKIDSIIITNYEHDSSGHRGVVLKAFTQNGTSPYTYSWSFGDASTSTSISPDDTNNVNHIYNDSNTTHSVILAVIDHLGTTATYNEQIEDTNITSHCRFAYSTSTPTPVVVSDSSKLSDITILYTDGSGNVYTSKNSSQPNTSTFQVLSVSDYKNNLSNEPTKELKVKFNCTLYSTTSNATLSANGTAIIAVAYQ